MSGATTPGLVCAHHHLYSSLARGMPAPPCPPTTFREVLERVWWRLDRALDHDLTSWSAKLGALEALECGTTAIVDHHSSPNAIDGSLDVVAAACAEVGVRVACAYEVTDRNGPAGAEAGLRENERFLRAGGRGWVGAHACFTLSPASLEAVAGLAADLGVGAHIHVHEGPEDVGAAARLAPLATPAWLLAHCVHLDESAEPLAGTVLHNPRSNMHNAVGYAHPARFAGTNPVALGTDGIGGAMLDEFRVAYARLRESDRTASPELAWSWLAEGWSLVPEALEDRVVWSYPTANPGHLAFTTDVRAVDVWVAGEQVLAGGAPCRVDGAEVRAKAAEAARRLFRRMEEL